MSTTLTTVQPPRAELADAPGLLPDSLTTALERLRHAFNVDFSVVDGHAARVLHEGEGQPAPDWSRYAELLRVVARRGRAELLAADDPLAVVAIPIGDAGDDWPVAVATFLTREVAPEEDLSALAEQHGARPDWLRRQTPWPPVALERMAELLVRHSALARREADLECEVNTLSTNLASTYEEISLLYRLTQGLRISRREEDLGRTALEWLSVVVPAQGLALHLLPVDLPVDEPGTAVPDARTESLVLTYGQCAVGDDPLCHLVGQLDLSASSGPLVANPPATDQAAWRHPAVRQLIVVPLTEGENLFGWLAAVNHREGLEFGTIEASLLSSVAAILGIHSGNSELYRQQAEFLAAVVRALTSAIDAKDPYTCGHSDRVARVSVRLAKELGEDADLLNTVYMAGLLHDIGKIGIDDNVLRKPGRLTDAEYEHIKQHPELGYRILKGLKQLDDVLPAVLHHHEQWNGRGYPHGLSGTGIPYIARIVAVADAFDAMSSDRPYRQGMPDEKLNEILRGGAGSQWDTGVIDAFFRARDDIRDISHHGRRRPVVSVDQWT